MADEVVRKDRDDSGKFLKGNKVPNPNRGRPHRADIMPFLTAVTGTYTPEEVSQMVKDTYDTAKEKEDWKGMYAVWSLVLAYAVGKPVQRSVTATLAPEDIRNMFRQEGDGEETEEFVDGDTVDVSPE